MNTNNNIHGGVLSRVFGGILAVAIWCAACVCVDNMHDQPEQKKQPNNVGCKHVEGGPFGPRIVTTKMQRGLIRNEYGPIIRWRRNLLYKYNSKTK